MPFRKSAKGSRYAILVCRGVLCSLVYLIWMATSVAGQYHFASWTTETGLPYNRINAILQTRDGYLWLATLDGLIRYDGVRFTVFNTGNTPGLKGNRCLSLFEDKDGQLWVGTEDSGLIRYRDGVFTTLTTDQGLPENYVRRIWADDKGNIVLLVVNTPYLWENEKAEKYQPPTNAPHFIIDSNQQNGRIWYRDDLGLHIITGGRVITLTPADGLSSLNVAAVYEDHQGTIWIGTQDAGLNQFRDGKITVFKTENGLPENAVRVITEDRAGNLWLAVGNSGIVQYKYGRFTNYTTAHGLSENNVSKMYVDREDTLWLGTPSRGLNRSSKDVVTMITEQTGLPANNVYPIFEDKEGNIWLGTWPKGLTMYRDGRYTLFTGKDGLAGHNVTAIAEDREGSIWTGAYGGISRLKDGQLTNLSYKLFSHPQYVSAVLQDRSGAMWFGTSLGLFRFQGEEVAVYRKNDGVLGGDDVRAILEDRKGVVWFGCYGGLTSYENGRWHTYTSKDGLAGDKVRSLYEDPDGVLWVGTYDGGISRIKDGKISSITQRDGLFSDGVFQILEDDRGFFWLSCNTGIYRVSKQQLNDFAEGKAKFVFSVAYGRADGLSNTECNGGAQPAGIRTSDGHLWFPTQGGVAVIDPRDIPFNPQPPPVVIEDCLLDRTAADCRQGLKISPGQQNLEISYAGLSFIKPDQVRFKYKMAGLDDQWIDVGTRRTAYFSHLPPGHYTFSVIAANSDGVWSKEGTSTHITVVPPFWRTWWFLSLCIIAVGAVILLTYRQSIRRLEKKSALQAAFSRQLIESQENERMRIASELHDGLGQNLVVIKNRALLGLATKDDENAAMDQLGEISTMASQAISEVRTIARNLRPYQLDRLGLTMAIQSIVTAVSASSNKITFTSDIDSIDNLLSSEGEINLYRIIQEAVNNIIKHSDATRASVAVKRRGATLEVAIEDNGKGFDAQDAMLTAGLGMLSLSERARILGGKIDTIDGWTRYDDNA